MKILKKIVVLFIILIGIFSFSKKENKIHKSSLNIEEVNVIDFLSKSKFECRPSSEIKFYVETKLVKKSRGYNTVDASVFVLDMISGEFNLLAKENVVVPFHKDSFINYTTEENSCGDNILINGDRIVSNNSSTPYCFSELIKYDVIYNSYLRSKAKLLKTK